MLLHRLRVTARSVVPRRLRPAATQALGAAVSFALAGEGVECPCCDRRFRSFVAYPDPYCPGCGSYPRHRLLARVLHADPDLCPPGSRLLHVGPEASTQRVLQSIGGIESTSIDLDHPLAQHRMDVTRMAFVDDFFDVAICFHVLSAVDDRAMALRELHRVLRPNGLLVLADPERQAELASYTDAANAAGFDPRILLPEEAATQEEIRRYGLAEDEWLCLCRR